MRIALVTVLACAASVMAAPALAVRDNFDPARLEARIDDLTSALEAADRFAEATDDNTGDGGLNERDESSVNIEFDPSTMATINKFEELFKDIDNVPDDVVNDNVKAAEYFYEHYAGNAKALAERSSIVARASVVSCIKELVTSIPIAKVFRFAKLIKKAGGVVKLAKKLVKCRTRELCQEILGDIGVEAFDIVTNIPSIAEACIP